MATRRWFFNRLRCMLVVNGLTSATIANSVLVREFPSIRQYKIRALAGSPMAARA
jgi:hypothetical protein